MFVGRIGVKDIIAKNSLEMSDNGFSKLLQQAEQLTMDIEGNEELPRVERSLGQVLEASMELHSKVTQSGANDVQAHILFGSKGIDLQQISQKLETLSAKRTLEPIQPIADSDTESYLRNERENAILMLIDEVNKNSLQTTEDQKWEHMVSEWNKEKTKLMNAMIGPSQNWLDISRTPEPLCDETKPFKQSYLDSTQAAYAKQIRTANKHVFQGSKMKTPLHDMFAEISIEFKDPKVVEMWEMIKLMCKIPPMTRDEDPLKVRADHKVQQFLIEQSKKYLENRYKLYMKDCVRAHPTASRGGEPGVYPLVRAFVALSLGMERQGFADGMVAGQPLWPMVYYCLRSGDPAAALRCVNTAGRDNEEFATALEEYSRDPEKPLTEKLQSAINFQYRIQVRNSTDAFKRAVYCIIGGCDLTEEHQEVIKTADDYLWLKLSQIKARSGENEAFTYSVLQKVILEEYGETHYNAYKKPQVYFQMLILSGQFEPAIEFLSRIPRYQVHSVHMALALHDVYLLGTPRNVQAPLLSVDTEDPHPLRRLNLARLLLLYVRKFELTDTLDALHYYFFLRKLKDPSGKNLFMCCCSDLALESRDYTLLFGKVDSSGSRSTGLLDEFSNPQIDSRVIALNVAEELVNKGLFEDAIVVYDIADRLDKVLELYCVLISQVMSGASTEGSSLRRRLAMLSEHITPRLRTGEAPPPALHDAYNKLCGLMAFFELYETDNYDAALEALGKCELVPRSRSDLDGRVSAARTARGEVLRCLPAVLRALNNILTAQRQRAAATAAHSRNLAPQAHEKQLEWLREQAEVLNVFAGNISYRMPKDTYSMLTQLQILMH